jgi:hypothetical protein
LYELFFQRPPTAEEIEDGKEFVTTFRAAQRTDTTEIVPSTSVVFGQANPNRGRRGQAPGRSPAPVHRPLTGWQEYAHALLLTNEASFVN